MGAVNIAKLRNHLSEYLDRASRGEEIIIRDRRLAVAKLVPLSRGRTFDERVRELAAQGLVRLPEKRLDWKAFFRSPAPKIPVEQLQAAIEAERDED